MNINILKTITGKKTSFSILSNIMVKNNVAYATDMETTAGMFLDQKLNDGLYSLNDFIFILDSKRNIPPNTHSEDYPDLPNVVGLAEIPYNISKTDLKRISKTSQYTLNGFLFEGSSIVSIDGRRLTKIDLPYDKIDGIIISDISKYVNEFNTSVSLNLNDNKAIFSDKRGFLCVNLLNGKFPNYQMFMSKDPGNCLQINFGLLKKATAKLKPYLNKQSKKLCLRITQDKTLITGDNADFDTMPIFEIKSNFPDTIDIGLCSTLLDFLENENKIYIKGDKFPCTIPGHNITKVIMPMMLDEETHPFRCKEIYKMKSAGFL